MVRSVSRYDEDHFARREAAALEFRRDSFYHHEKAFFNLSRNVGGGGGGVELESTMTIIFSPWWPTEYSCLSAASLPRSVCSCVMFCWSVACWAERVASAACDC